MSIAPGPKCQASVAGKITSGEKYPRPPLLVACARPVFRRCEAGIEQDVTPVLAAVSATQDRFIARFEIVGAVGHAENPDARLGADRDIPERAVRPDEAHRSRDRHVDSRIGRNRIGKLCRDRFAARRLAGLLGVREGRATGEEGIGQQCLCRALPRDQGESDTGNDTRIAQDRTRAGRAARLHGTGRVTMKMAEFGLWAAFAGGLPDNACDAAAEALNATAWGG